MKCVGLNINVLAGLLMFSLSMEAHAGLDFLFPKKAVTKAVQALKKDQDPAAMEILKKVPAASKDLSSSFADRWVVTFQKLATPAELVAEDGVLPEYVFSSPLGYPKFKYFLIEDLLPTSLKNWSDEDQRRYPYRYYEQPGTTVPDYVNIGHEDAPRALVRRIISTPEFMGEFCDNTVLDVAEWTYQWGLLIAKAGGEQKATEWKNGIENSISGVESFLQVLGRSKWSDEPPQDLEKNGIRPFLFRRYLDGGPKFAQAALDCVHGVQKRISYKSMPYPTDTFSKFLNFEFLFRTTWGEYTQEIASRKLSADSLARIMRLYPSSSSLTQPLRIESSGGGELVVALTLWMSEMDPKYNYRILTTKEAAYYETHDKCTVNKQYNSQDLESLVFPENCYFEDLSYTLVREYKN
jgi:hypothetical protein